MSCEHYNSAMMATLNVMRQMTGRDHSRRCRNATVPHFQLARSRRQFVAGIVANCGAVAGFGSPDPALARDGERRKIATTTLSNGSV